MRKLLAGGKTERAIDVLISLLKENETLYFEYEEAIKISALYKKKVRDAGLGLENTD
ncbi:hypothetical protein R9C00_18400 [Flammeovirgaceae bacterium SG7u.111]|nr:hypothetical protein [Flammeovirgaceae bacterium SG7u.132]WPO33676.1 hypothetical protein R9C00_18400 [Flammeovirgaceae bacterium SG7u.111]